MTDSIQQDQGGTGVPTAVFPSRPVEMPEEPARRVEICIPLATFLKVFAAILAGYIAYKLWPLLMLICLALLVAVTFYPLVLWLDSRGLKRWASLFIVVGGMLVTLAVGVALIVPAVVEQVGMVTKNLPVLRNDVLNWFPAGSILHQDAEHLLGSADWSQVGAWTGQFLSAGGIALSGISEMLVMLVIAIYLMVDGHKIYRWLLAFFAPGDRRKLRNTADEISKVIFSYVAGQVVTSALVMIYAFTVLTFLHVPSPLMLSLLAGVFDILPILGIILSTAPACLLALSVSPRTALLVIGFYLIYHVFESYVIVPKVYGQSLRLSTLTVLLGLLAGVLLAGIPGAVAALPLLASYSVVEQIWLQPFLGAGVAEKHEMLKDEEFGERA